eukprot:TRINITY_DN20776_c0_g1_i1.p1 TRINITY_DN20776_c0_g1~~TRINITY_DN20776_c0_g1_i1.p1  ORF type:complete len:673 (+),score=94.12 TRINITY_DN20776_c0_g1_i1:55-2073(+)
MAQASSSHHDNTPAPSDDRVNVISWNVAGWTSTHNLIRSHYGDLALYLQRFGRPAIFCVQETKLHAKELQVEGDARKFGAIAGEYQSYWAFNESSDPKRKNMQGVATWVHRDIPCLGATQRVFGDQALDDQGRALLSDHGSFVVLNVYAPHVAKTNEDTAKEALRIKAAFFAGLSRRMENLKAQGKRVIVCGDLNLTYRKQDQQLSRRRIWVDSDGQAQLPQQIRELAANCVVDEKSSVSGEQAQAMPDLAGKWATIKDVAERLSLPLEAFSDVGECCHAAEEACVQTLRSWFEMPAEGEASHERSEWADVFAAVHPAAEHRFTAWCQSFNLRYANVGTRLDYTIVDRETFDACVVKSPSTLLPGGSVADGRSPNSPQAALHAATAGGSWHGAAMSGIACGDGLTMQQDDMRLNDTQFPAEPYTGLIYTPPGYSDHIAVSVLFTRHLLKNDSARSEGFGALMSPQESRASQPWSKQRSLMSLFKPSVQAATVVTPAIACTRSKTVSSSADASDVCTLPEQKEVVKCPPEARPFEAPIVGKAKAVRRKPARGDSSMSIDETPSRPAMADGTTPLQQTPSSLAKRKSAATETCKAVEVSPRKQILAVQVDTTEAVVAPKAAAKLKAKSKGKRSSTRTNGRSEVSSARSLEAAFAAGQTTETAKSATPKRRRNNA